MQQITKMHSTDAIYDTLKASVDHAIKTEPDYPTLTNAIDHIALHLTAARNAAAYPVVPHRTADCCETLLDIAVIIMRTIYTFNPELPEPDDTP